VWCFFFFQARVWRTIRLEARSSWSLPELLGLKAWATSAWVEYHFHFALLFPSLASLTIVSCLEFQVCGFLFFFFLVRLGCECGFMPAKQVFYHLAMSSVHFALGYFGDGVSELFAWAGLDWLEAACLCAQVAPSSCPVWTQVRYLMYQSGI
jgi:hypothetical protein